MHIDASTTLENARCFLCLTDDQALAIQTYSLAVIAALDPDPAALLSASVCMKCLPDVVLSAYQAGLMWANSGSELTPDEVVADSSCAKCIPSRYLEQIKAYQYATSAGLALDPTALASASRCLLCFNHHQHMMVQTYLLCVGSGAGACGEPGNPIPPSLAPLLSQWIEIAYAVGGPGVNYIITGFDGEGLSPDYLAVGPTVTFDPFWQTTTPSWWDVTLHINFNDPSHVDLPLTGFVEIWSSTDQITYTLEETVPYPGGVLDRAYTNVINTSGTIYYLVRWTNGGTVYGAYSSELTVSLSNLVIDTFESYSDGAVSGNNGGTGWLTAYGVRDYDGNAEDDMESYANNDAVNGLNGGLFWDGAYVTR